MSVSQVASVVAREEGSIRDAMADVEPCRTGTDAPSCDFGARISYLTVSISAETLLTRLRGIDDPPAEVTVLLADTIDAAAAVVEAHEKVCEPNESCPAGNFDFHRAVGELERTLDAWAPYM